MKSIIIFLISLNIMAADPIQPFVDHQAGDKIESSFFVKIQNIIDDVLDRPIQVKPTVFSGTVYASGSLATVVPSGGLNMSCSSYSSVSQVCGWTLASTPICTSSINTGAGGNSVYVRTFGVSHSEIGFEFSSSDKKDLNFTCQKTGADYNESFKTLRELVNEYRSLLP